MMHSIECACEDRRGLTAGLSFDCGSIPRARSYARDCCLAYSPIALHSVEQVIPTPAPAGSISWPAFPMPNSIAKIAAASKGDAFCVSSRSQTTPVDAEWGKYQRAQAVYVSAPRPIDSCGPSLPMTQGATKAPGPMQ